MLQKRIDAPGHAEFIEKPNQKAQLAESARRILGRTVEVPA
jgi:hypothetical protein